MNTRQNPASPAEKLPGIVVPAPKRPDGSPLTGISHVIAVGSGKGGVGKSTTAVNLAVALSTLGARVGILDADIYGPSVPKLLGAFAAPTEDPQKQKIIPPIAQGIKVMSMGALNSDTPVVWRGPMASRAVTQFLSEVDWGELDYLIVDLPPGTGDIQLTLAQSARLSGAIIVMTPQRLAGDIAKRGLKMFQQLRIPVIGLVENMSEYECPECGHKDSVFRSGGGDLVSKELGIPLLSQVPLDPTLVVEGDEGSPVVISRPDSKIAKVYFDMARSMAAELSAIMSGSRKSNLEVASMEPNQVAKLFKIVWSDGHQSVVTFKELRFNCPCANCVDENSGQRKVQREKIDDDVKPLKVQTVGNYAINVAFSDGHNTGIYSYDYLARLMGRDKG